MTNYYSNEKNIQMIISLLKANGINKVIASPGTTNITFVASVQQDPFFKVYSSVDERSAAYLACGLAEETEEPVVLTCTGATASRNYVAPLTEAYYKHLPIIALTATQSTAKIGNLIPQIIDRFAPMKDIFKYNITLDIPQSEDDVWGNNLKINKAFLELKDGECAPIHLNVVTKYTREFEIKKLPDTRIINSYSIDDNLPTIKDVNKIAIFIGSHSIFSKNLVNSIERFCEIYNALVICDNTSNYFGKYRVNPSLVSNNLRGYNNIDLMIHIGNISGGYYGLNPSCVWRVNEDGEARDYYKALKNVFDMSEQEFFSYYTKDNLYNSNLENYKQYVEEDNKLRSKINDIPFSNLWIAMQTASKIPKNSIVHLGILNSLRSWNFFDLGKDVVCYCNTGGFGIDGCLSTFLGSALEHKDGLNFAILGDLAFFYDINVLTKITCKSNVRIMLINNGVGTEFKNYNHFASMFGNDANKYIAAAGHFGNKSENLIKDFAKNIGFDYISAKNKHEYLNNYEKFLNINNSRSIIFEIFTSSVDESNALYEFNNIVPQKQHNLKKIVKKLIGPKLTNKIKVFKRILINK